MKLRSLVLSLCAITCCTLMITSCSKEQNTEKKEEIPVDYLDKIKAKGFSTYNVQKTDKGYIVEGDILLTEESLNDTSGLRLRGANGEQYRTDNLVSGLPRTITIAITGLPTVYTTGLDAAITRYNELGLRLTFQRVSGPADITVSGFYEGPVNGGIVLGSAGFPSGGNPHSAITMNTHPDAYGSSPSWQSIASVLQHEIGHCIGLRHTDYFNRSSCPYSMQGNETAGSYGAIHLPGTPTAEDASSFMNACNIGTRTFNSNDVEALLFLYGYPPSMNEGRFIRDGETGAMYWVFEGKLRYIASIDTYQYFFGRNIAEAQDWQQYRTSTLAPLPQGETILWPYVSLIKTATNPAVYFAEKYTNGVPKEKRWIYTHNALMTYFGSTTIAVVSQAEMDSYPTGTNIVY